MNLKPFEKIKIWNLRNYSELRIQNFEDISKKGISKQKDDINYSCVVRGIKVYFIIYTQRDYPVRHLYLSKKNNFPSKENVNILLKEFGFNGRLLEEGASEGLVFSVDEKNFAFSMSELV